jgi:hypothetical protein
LTESISENTSDGDTGITETEVIPALICPHGRIEQDFRFYEENLPAIPPQANPKYSH